MKPILLLPLLLLPACAQTPTGARPASSDPATVTIESELNESFAAIQDLARATCEDRGLGSPSLQSRHVERSPARYLPWRVSTFRCR